MIRAVTFDKQLLKSEDFAHQVNYFYQGKMGVTRGCTITTNTDGDLVVADGYFTIYGRLIRNVGNTVVDVPAVASGTLYSILVFEVDLSKENTIDTFNQGSFKIVSNASAYPTLTKQDLDNGGTIYQLEFCRFENKVTGIANLTDTRTILSLSMYTQYSDIINNATTTTSGKVLDARMGKALQDSITTNVQTINTSLTPIDFTNSITYSGGISTKNVSAKYYPAIKLVVINFNCIFSTSLSAGSNWIVFTVPTEYKPKAICYVPLASTTPSIAIQGLMSNSDGVLFAYGAGGSFGMARGMMVYDVA